MIAKNLLRNTMLVAFSVALASAATVNQRRENQQDRIAQGVKTGQLTAGETARLEKKETKLNRKIRRNRASNGGHLTAAERARVSRDQNKVSRAIYRDEHNGVKQ